MQALRIAGFVSAILRRGVDVVELAEETDSSGNTDLQTAVPKWLEKANQTLVIKTGRNLSIRRLPNGPLPARSLIEDFLSLAVGPLGFALRPRRTAYYCLPLLILSPMIFRQIPSLKVWRVVGKAYCMNGELLESNIIAA